MPFSSEALRAARIQARLTQEELAAIVHCSPQAVRAWEQGLRRPSDESLLRLAYKLRVHPDDLTTDPSPQPVSAA